MRPSRPAAARNPASTKSNAARTASRIANITRRPPRRTIRPSKGSDATSATNRPKGADATSATSLSLAFHLLGLALHSAAVAEVASDPLRAAASRDNLEASPEVLVALGERGDMRAADGDRDLEDPQQREEREPRVEQAEREAGCARCDRFAERRARMRAYRRPVAVELGEGLAHARLMKDPRTGRREDAGSDVGVEERDRAGCLVIREQRVEPGAA